jgi:flagella basal body P-ring formation protein FlgA
MALLNRNTGFLLGNLIGITVLVAGILITAPQKQAEQAEIDKRNSQAVVVSLADLKAGARISADLLKEERKPHEEVPLNAVESAKKIIGLLTKSDIKKGQIVTYSLLDLQSRESQPLEDKRKDAK